MNATLPHLPSKEHTRPGAVLPEAQRGAPSGIRFSPAGLILIALAGLISIPILAVTGAYLYHLLTGTIFPGVQVLDTPLGGLTQAQAQARLEQTWNQSHLWTVTDGQQAWDVQPFVFGLDLDAPGSAQRAFDVGRQHGPFNAVTTMLRGAFERIPVTPAIHFDPQAAHLGLTAAAAVIDVPSQDAGLVYQDGVLRALPGRPGYRIDLDATLAQIAADPISTYAGHIAPLVLSPTEPEITDLAPVLSQVQALTSQPISLVAFDLVTQDRIEWPLSSELRLSWLRPLQVGGQLTLAFDPQRVENSLHQWSASLGGGRWIDVAHYSPQVIQALHEGSPPLMLVHRPEVDSSAAQGVLSQALAIEIHDPIHNQWFDWHVPPEIVAGWLYLDGEALKVQQEHLTQALDEWSARTLGEDRYLDPAESAAAIETALAAGAKATLLARQRGSSYVIQPGDTLVSVGWAVGMPYWYLFDANPGLQSRGISTGQVLNVPPKDVLLPLPVVAHKRIVISIREQHMWIYENRELLSEHVISTGIDRSPTQPGVYQVRSHYETAYASIWDLTMPHFLGIYEAWPGFENGIHGLPTLSNGRLLWADVLGRPASYGCIITDLETAAWLFEWAEAGVVVEIQG